MLKRFAATLLLGACIQSLAAADIIDYAYQAPIRTNDARLQRIELPLEILLASTRASLSDVAVFNADGESLPHTVLPTPDRFLDLTMQLPFHRFDRFLVERDKTVTRREQTLQQDLLAETETTETIAVQTVRNDYLIELMPDSEERRFTAIDLEWRHQPASQILGVRVEAGNEIDRLRTIRPRKSLSGSESGDPDWRSIRNIPAHNRYLRLIPLDGITLFELERVSGHYREKLPAPLLTYSLEPELVSDDTGDYYYFRFPTVMTAETMRIVPTGPQAIINGDLYISSRAEPENRQLAERGFRQHNIDDPEIKPSRPFNMTRLYPHGVWFTTERKPAATPRIELTYPQFELIFLADGNGPYRLAWGNHAQQSPTNGLAEMLAIDLTDPEQRGALVRLGATGLAGGPERLEPSRILPWKKWLLWVLLMLAAVVTGRMALRLYREMNQAQN